MSQLFFASHASQRACVFEASSKIDRPSAMSNALDASAKTFLNFILFLCYVTPC